MSKSNEKAIYKFYADCGRMGFLDGVFVAEKQKVKNIIGKKVYFGEVLGKHSEIYGTIEEDEITFISDDPHFVELFEKHDLSSGYNPIEYYELDNYDEEE